MRPARQAFEQALKVPTEGYDARWCLRGSGDAVCGLAYAIVY